jgi:IS30 family transposase
MNYRHLNISERIVISQLYSCGVPIREIAKQLQRSPSTISRELKRNSYKTGIHHCMTRYSAAVAQDKYEDNKKKCGRKQISCEAMAAYIKEKVELRWSPDEIYHRDHPGVDLPSVGTIYRMIHQHRLGNICMDRLRRKGRFQRPAEARGRFNDGGRTIQKRDRQIYKRKELGHWEGDTVESGRIDHQRKSKYCFVTLAERKSRFYIAILVPNRTSQEVTPAIIKALKEFPPQLVQTITFDRGKEFSGYREVESSLNCKTYFCDPYCAWQKGTNENTNGLLREFYPKGMDLSNVSIDELNSNLELLNGRPRKCLGYKTPTEMMLGQSSH